MAEPPNPQPEPGPERASPRRRSILLLAACLAGACAIVTASRCTPNHRSTRAAPAGSHEPGAAKPPTTSGHEHAPAAAPALPPATCPAGAVCGRVLDEAGAAIAGAEVTVGQRGAVLGEVQTNAEGVFVLPAHSVVASLASLDDGELWFNAEAHGFVPMARMDHALPLATELVLRLKRGAVLLGRVLRDDDGEPVAGAEVMAISGPSSEDDADAPATTTDRDGRFRLEGLEDGVFKPAARARGLFAQGATITLRRGTDAPEVTLRMKPMPTVVGRLVFASNDSACASGEVTLRSKTLPWHTAQTDVHGGVIFPAVLPGTYEVWLSCEGHVDDERAPPLAIDGADLASTTQRTFVLHEKLVIHGVVVDTTGAPVPGVDIGCRPAGGKPNTELDTMSTARTDLDGRFSLRGLDPGGYEVALLDGVDNAVVRTTVGARSPAPDLRLLWDKVRLRGRVVDETGAPVPTANLRLRRAGNDDGALSTDVDGEGRFATEHFRPGPIEIATQLDGEPVAIVGGQGDGSLAVSLPLATRDQDHDHDGLVLVVRAPHGTVEGTVIGAHTPGEIEVWAECSASGTAGVAPVLDESGHPLRHREPSSTSTSRASTTADARGQFLLTHLPPEHSCVVRARNEAGESAVVEGVHVGARVDLPLRPPAAVHGTIAGAGASFTVTASLATLPGQSRFERFIGTAGVWSLAGLPAAKYRIEIETEHATAHATVDLAPGDDREVAMTLRTEEAGAEAGGDDTGSD